MNTPPVPARPHGLPVVPATTPTPTEPLNPTTSDHSLQPTISSTAITNEWKGTLMLLVNSAQHTDNTSWIGKG